ncbi:MAG: hypothetical protein U1E93_03860 [Alphaproteobacteria bacterium]
MLLWAGFLSILIGIAALAIDRVPWPISSDDHVSARAHRALDGITHYAKAGHWLAAAILALIVAAGMRHFDAAGPGHHADQLFGGLHRPA